MVTRSNFRTWEDNQSIKILHKSLEAFNEGNKGIGLIIFGLLHSQSLEHAHKVYGFLWIIKGKPSGIPEYGRYSFHDINGLSSTAREKAKAISQYLNVISIYNAKIQGAHCALLKSIETKAKKNERSWKEYLLEGAVVAGEIAAIGSAVFTIFSALKGSGGGMRLRPSVPGHITVGGGHMNLANHVDLANRVIVGSGHMNNAIKNIKESGMQLSVTKNTFDSVRIENCVSEYPTPGELRESNARYENQQLERIHQEYNDALWRERQFGIPVDHEKFKQDIQRLAEELGKESWEALLKAIGESIAAGGTIEIPPIAIIEGYNAFEDFKKFGALAEESARLRELADRWGK